MINMESRSLLKTIHRDLYEQHDREGNDLRDNVENSGPALFFNAKPSFLHTAVTTLDFAQQYLINLHQWVDKSF